MTSTRAPSPSAGRRPTTGEKRERMGRRSAWASASARLNVENCNNRKDKVVIPSSNYRLRIVSSYAVSASVQTSKATDFRHVVHINAPRSCAKAGILYHKGYIVFGVKEKPSARHSRICSKSVRACLAKVADTVVQFHISLKDQVCEVTFLQTIAC